VYDLVMEMNTTLGNATNLLGALEDMLN
jgi:hypothetical protein